MTRSPMLARFAALGLLALLLLAAWLAVAPVFDYSRELRTERGRLVDWLQRYRSVRASTATVDTRLAELERVREGQRSAYLRGATPALAAVSLQERVKQVAAATGAQLTSTRILAEEESGNLTRIAITVELQTRIDALRSMLHEIESGRPTLFVDELSVNRRVVIPTVEPGASEPVLSVRMQISGYKSAQRPPAPAREDA